VIRPPLLPSSDPVERLSVLMLEVHDRCACRCLMCDLWRSDPTNHSPELDLTLLESWLPGWAKLGVKRIGLTGGEPLLHPDVEGLLAMLGRAGSRLTLMTAGTGLAHHTEAVAHWCDSVVVSLDGPRDIHDAVRRSPGAFAELQTGVAELRDRCGISIRITARCTVQRANLGHLADTVETARTMGLDGISFLPIDTAAGSFGGTPGSDHGRRRRALCPGVDDLDNLAVELETVARDTSTNRTSSFVAEDHRTLVTRVLEHFRAENGLAPHRARPCNAPWVSAVIGTDGSVRPCFFHAAYGRCDRDEELGAVLNANHAREQRNRLDVVDNPICRRCVCPLALRQGEDPR